MHWFDDFSKGVAGKGPTRSAVLDGLVRLAAGAAIAPLATHPSVAYARSEQVTELGRGARVVPGMPRRKSKRLGTIARGPCSFTCGDATSTSFTASAGSLELTMGSRFSPDDSSRSAALSGRFTIDVTDGGEPVLHRE